MEEENKILGCGGYYILSDTLEAGMAWGMIHHSFHKKGYGQQLTTFRIDELQKSLSGQNISLHTSQHTFRFYERFGFTVTKITPDGFAKGIDKYEMVLCP